MIVRKHSEQPITNYAGAAAVCSAGGCGARFVQQMEGMGMIIPACGGRWSRRGRAERACDG